MIQLHRFAATVLFALEFHAVTAQGQTYIFGRADFPVGNHPIAVAVGDFNGDGLIDVAVTNSADNTVSILLGRPDGTLAPQTTYPTGPQPVAIAVADFNGDGRLDLAVTNENCTAGKYAPNCSPSTVSILLGNGDGTFQQHLDFGVGALPSSVVVADFNGDGKLDLAVTNAFDATVSVLLGNGDGTLQPQIVYATAGTSVQNPWQSAVVGDFNNDGKLDLAMNCGSVVSVLVGNGDGTFGAHIDSSVGNIDSGFGGAFLAAGDFNHDGRLDVVASGGGFISVLLGNGDGTFILQAQYPGGGPVTADDLNRDGKLDVVLSGQSRTVGNTADSVAILLGNGDGTFQSAVPYGTGSSASGFAICDLNGDAKLDLVVANSGSGTISVLLGFGDGTFVGKADYGTGGTFSLAVISADFNRDGKLDLAAANYGADSVSVLLGNGDGTFQPEVSYPTGHYPGSLAVGDFRNNGDVDLVTSNQTCFNPPCNPGSVSVLLGIGNGTFQPHVEYGAGITPYNVAVGDFRGNGELDLAVANIGSGSVSILLGKGDGTFQPKVDYLVPFAYQSAIGDFIQDGNADLAVAAGNVSILLGNGNGTFKTPTNYPVGAGTLAIGDFNGDGKLDLATGGGHDLISILLGNGDGTFQAPVNYQTGVSANVVSIVVTDFNNDGKLDLAVNTDGVESLIFLGNGDGTFQQPIEYLLANRGVSSSFTVGDFNGDGIPDWAAPDAGTNTIGVMLSTPFKAVSPASLSFGSQGTGTTSSLQTITISNPSNVKINIAGVTSSGNFSQTSNCGASLSPGASCQVSVTFSPSATGPQSGAITVTDSTRISPLAIPLSGTGVSGAFLTPYPSRENFSPQAVGASSNPSAIVLENTGNASLNVTGISITGVNSSDFSQANNCGGSLAPASSCTVNVKFTPTSGGSRIASLSVSDTAPASPQTVTLSGIGVAPPDFNIGPASGSPTSQTINAGQGAMFKLVLTPSGGFTGTANLSCAITPTVTSAPTCSFSSSTVQISGTTSQSVTVTVGTTAATMTSVEPYVILSPGAPWMWMLLVPSSLCLFVRRRRRLPAPALAASVLAVAAALCAASCGGGSSHAMNPGTTPGTYTATVTATSGSLTHITSLQVTVQ